MPCCEHENPDECPNHGPKVMPRGYPVKLVRDRIDQVLGGEGTVTYEVFRDRDQHVALLRRKLVEEAAEYLADPTLEELADVLEVVWSLARVDLDCPWTSVADRFMAKRTERGGLDGGVIMVAHHPADGDHA